MNRKVFVIVLVTVLAVSISMGIILYSQSQQEPQQTSPYTVIGTLSYAPGHAIYPGISATSITPNVSPEPSTRTFIDMGGENDTVLLSSS